jgi:hypothetical protein
MRARAKRKGQRGSKKEFVEKSLFGKWTSKKEDI